MPRFNPTRYTVHTDSTPGEGVANLRNRRPDLGNCVILAADKGECPCGCRLTPAGTKSKFCMGHDARYRGMLLRAARTSTPVATWAPSTGDVVVHAPAALLDAEGWSRYLEFTPQYMRPRPNPQPPAYRETTVKIGRWTYTARVMPDGLGIYFDRSGQSHPLPAKYTEVTQAA